MEHVTTVLIADSADDFCTALTAALQHADGFQVVGTANDGEQAIRMVEERKPDVLVLDLMLSKKDGISVLKAVSGMERRPITLATSVFVTQYVSAAAANLGAILFTASTIFIIAYLIVSSYLSMLFILYISSFFIFLFADIYVSLKENASPHLDTTVR